MTLEEKTNLWETEVGLPNDIDAWISNPRFGQKDEYAKKVQASGGGDGNMFLVDLIDESGELVGTQGYSVGSGWIVSDDGKEISHPKRKNVVGSSLYGQLQNKVRRELGVAMEERGLPTQAKSWDGLGFHWLLEEHDTVGGVKGRGLMPVEFLSEKKGITPVVTTSKVGIKVPEVLELQLKTLAQSNTVKDFQKAALKVPEVVADDELMASVLDEGPAGFWSTHQ